MAYQKNTRNTPREEINEKITTAIIKALESGVKPWVKPWKTARPANAVTGKPYSGINVLLLGIQPYTDNRWITFAQAIDLCKKWKGEGECPKFLKPNQKTTMCVRWFQNVKKDNETEEVTSYGYLKTFLLFNIEQTNLVEMGLLSPFVPENVGEFQAIENAEKIIKGYVGCPKIIEAGDRACYSFDLDVVHMPKKGAFLCPAMYYSTLFHELGHSTGHKNRLGREGIVKFDKFGSPKYAFEELVAEMTAAFLANHAGLESGLDQNAAYIDGWLVPLVGNPKMIERAASAAQKAFDLIIGDNKEDEEDEEGEGE